jgi:hypothetical protein
VSPNEFLAPRWDELVARLALGIEPTDPVRRSRIAWPLEVAADGVPYPAPRTLRDPRAGPWDGTDVLRRVERRDSCRFVVTLRDGTAGPLELRFLDRAQRYVPRRMRIHLPDPVDTGRIVRPALFPGAAYPVPTGALGVRGQVLRGGVPMRWARVEARRPGGGAVVGRAHGDEHGEFLLLLEPAAAAGAELPRPLRVRVAVFGPDEPPDPDDAPDPAADPLWDLPLEEAELDGGGAEALAGARLPDGYREGVSREVVIGLGGPGREKFDFS